MRREAIGVRKHPILHYQFSFIHSPLSSRLLDRRPHFSQHGACSLKTTADFHSRLSPDSHANYRRTSTRSETKSV
jgi:hypothetical protein